MTALDMLFIVFCILVTVCFVGYALTIFLMRLNNSNPFESLSDLDRKKEKKDR